MKKIIFSVLIAMAVIIMLISVSTASLVHYDFYLRQSEGKLHTIGELVKNDFNDIYMIEDYDKLAKQVDLASPNYPIRITIIDSNGIVLYDNTADAAKL